MIASTLPPTFGFIEQYLTLFQIALGKADLFDGNNALRHKSKGRVAYWKVGKEWSYFFYHPEHAKYILHDNASNYPKISDTYCPQAFRLMKTSMGLGLITTDGPVWKAQKKTVSPYFLGKVIPTYDEHLQYTLNNTLTYLKEKMRSGESFNIEPTLRSIAFTMISLIIFSQDLNREGEHMRNVLDICLQDFNRRSSSLVLPPWLPTPWNLKLKSSIRYLTQSIYKHYRHRQESGEYPADILTLLMKTTDDNTGEPLSFQQVRDQIVTLILAGHETTASAMAWLVYLIATHPECEERLMAEWDFSGHSPRYYELERFTYTKMVVQEALRLYPSVWIIARTCKNGDTVDGYEIRKDSNINIALYFVHRHPDFWKDPEKFDPDRFHPSKVSSIHEYAYLPFSHGPHACVGRHLAMFELMAAIPAIFRMFKVKIPEDANIVKECIISVRPKYGVNVLLEPRSTSHTKRKPPAPGIRLAEQHTMS